MHDSSLGTSILSGVHISVNVQKNPRVCKIFRPQFWGRKWLRQFYGRLENAFFLQENHVHDILRFRGAVIVGFGRGEKRRFYFHGRGDFSVNVPHLVFAF